MPARFNCRATTIIMPTMSFMSTAPRPQTKPSSIAPENGCTLHSAGSAGTTSRCPWISSAPRELSAPGRRANTLPRPGAPDSTYCGW